MYVCFSSESASLSVSYIKATHTHTEHTKHTQTHTLLQPLIHSNLNKKKNKFHTDFSLAPSLKFMISNNIVAQKQVSHHTAVTPNDTSVFIYCIYNIQTET